MNELRLSPAQKKVVNHVEGPLLVVAGPGSGKTRVLTERVRRLLSEEEGHFRVLALTFTNKAANEMAERLEVLGELRERAFIGTLHGFCLEMLTDRGKPLGITGSPQIFERLADRRQILQEAVMADPFLSETLSSVTDEKERKKLVDYWLQSVAQIKAHPQSSDFDLMDIDVVRVYEEYNSSLRATGAFDFDDLLLLSYRLLTEFPKIANFYRRLYKFICVDEAQDLNEAQYCVLRALCGDSFGNLMLVGDPKQSIYGFNTSSPRYMNQFYEDFGAELIELHENFRSSRAVVEAAKKLQPSYEVNGSLPVMGELKLAVTADEKSEAIAIVNHILFLLENGHPDIEGELVPNRIAVLGRTRFSLLNLESALRERNVSFYKRLSAAHEFESEAVKDFLLAMRLAANPKDRFHYRVLAKGWGVANPIWKDLGDAKEASNFLLELAQQSTKDYALPVAQAVRDFCTPEYPSMNSSLAPLREYSNSLQEDPRRTIYEDIAVLDKVWDEYLRATSPAARSVASFVSNMALGSTQNTTDSGVALLTVHASKGVEFDVVFVCGMADGVFPDFRAKANPGALEEERRSAFVAITRSKRLLYFSYPKTRVMPWGDVWQNKPSPYLNILGLI